jgi:hypothetical protein
MMAWKAALFDFATAWVEQDWKNLSRILARGAGSPLISATYASELVSSLLEFLNPGKYFWKHLEICLKTDQEWRKRC